jgi:hypothetical protein
VVKQYLKILQAIQKYIMTNHIRTP